MSESTLIILIIIGALVAKFFPNIWARIIGGATAVLSIIGIIYLQFFIVDPLINEGIDVAVELAEQFEIVNIPDSVCPDNFNRTDYCVEFGLEKGELNGQVFLTGQVNEVVDVRLETKEKIVRCPLEKGKACKFAKLNSIDDFKVSLTDKRGNAIVEATNLRQKVKQYTRALQLAKAGKTINKFI